MNWTTLLIFAAIFINSAAFAQTANEPSQILGTVEFSKYSDEISPNKNRNGAADSIFDYISDELGFIEFDDCNNCDSRAHLISAIVKKKFQVTIGKVWLFAESKLHSKAAEYKYKPHVYLSDRDDCNKWGYHVAPVIITEHTGGSENFPVYDTLVIDPSTQDSAVSILEWAEYLVQPGGKGLLIIKSDIFRSFPDDNEGRFYDNKKLWKSTERESLYDDDYTKSISGVLSARLGVTEPWMYRHLEMKIRKLLE